MKQKIFLSLLFAILLINQALAESPDIVINISAEMSETPELNQNYTLDLTIKNTGNNTIKDIEGFIDSVFNIININDNSIKLSSLDPGDVEKFRYKFNLMKQADNVEIRAKINSYEINNTLLIYGSKNFSVESEVITVPRIEKVSSQDESIKQRTPRYLIIAVILIVVLTILSIGLSKLFKRL